MPNLRTGYASSPSRIRLQCDSAAPLTAASYTLRRKDSGPGSPSVTLAFLANPADASTVDLALSTPLLDAVSFTVALSGGGTVDVSYRPAVTTADRISFDDDPEAEALGIDLAWVDGDPDASGDCPRRRGLDSLRHDLPMRALLGTNELVQAPDAGGGLYPKVNSPGSDAELLEDAGRIESDLRSDPRVDQLQVDAVNDGGTAELSILVKPVALDSFIKVTTNG